MTEHRSHQSRSSERGFVIVAALWIIIALAALATIFASYLSSSARAVALSDSALLREALVSASQELTAYRLLMAERSKRPTYGAFQFRMDDADVSVSFKSEASRIDLNLASKAMLAGLFAGLGASQDVADGAAKSIIAWRRRASKGDGTLQNDDNDDNAAANDAQSNNAALSSGNGDSTSTALEGLAQTNNSKSMFAHVNQLAMLDDVPPALIERALPFLTVFNGTNGIDARIAEPQVLAALPGMTPLKLKDFLDQLANLPDGAPIQNTSLPGGNKLLMAKSQAYRIETTIRFRSGRRTQSESVIVVGGKDEPFRVLSWQDGVPPRADLSKSTRL